MWAKLIAVAGGALPFALVWSGLIDPPFAAWLWGGFLAALLLIMAIAIRLGVSKACDLYQQGVVLPATVLHSSVLFGVFVSVRLQFYAPMVGRVSGHVSGIGSMPSRFPCRAGDEIPILFRDRPRIFGIYTTRGIYCGREFRADPDPAFDLA